MKTRKIFLLDLMPLVFRAYFATVGKSISTSSGLSTGGILGFYNYIFQIIFSEHPDVIIAAQDSAPEQRLEIDPQYKAQREQAPEDLESAIEYAYALLHALQIPVLTSKGKEADDVIGSLVKEFQGNGSIYIVSPDKDFAQLVGGSTYLFRPAYKGVEFNLLDREGVIEKYGVPPEQIPDLLALMGDQVDNIKGVPGVGPKTAIKILQETGSVENIYNGYLENLKEGKLKQSLKDYKEQCFTGKKLAIIDTSIKFQDVLNYSFSSKQIKHRDLNLLLEQLEFRKLAERLEEKGFLPLASLTEARKGIYVEAGELPESRMCGVVMSQPGEFLVVVDSSIYKTDDRDNLITLLKGFEVIITADLKGLIKHIGDDRSLANRFFDVTIAEYLLNPDKSVDVDHLARKHKINLSGIQAADAEQVGLSLKEIYTDQGPEIQEMGLDSLLKKVEIPLAIVLAEMEESGLYMDVQVLDETGEELRTQIAALENRIYQLAGKQFNINSIVQIGEVLESLLGPGLKKTKTGKISSSERILDELKGSHEIIDHLLKYRKLAKLYSTYVTALPKYISPDTGRIHASFSQTTAGTGRLSCSHPNLQNLPVKNEEGRIIRKAVVPQQPGFVIVSADYSQIELRLLAELSGDEALLAAFNRGDDIHSITASGILKIPLEQVTEKERNIAKGVNFGIVYGITPFGLSDRLKIPQSDAKEFILNYFISFPKVKSFQEKTLEFAREHGFTRTMTGRIRYIDGINSRNGTLRRNAERVALNAPIQGLAADLIKKAMINCSEKLHEGRYNTKMILQVHDELVFEAAEEELKEIIPLIRQGMETALPVKVSLKVEIGYGPNWMNLNYD